MPQILRWGKTKLQLTLPLPIKLSEFYAPDSGNESRALSALEVSEQKRVFAVIDFEILLGYLSEYVRAEAHGASAVSAEGEIVSVQKSLDALTYEVRRDLPLFSGISYNRSAHKDLVETLLKDLSTEDKVERAKNLIQDACSDSYPAYLDKETIDALLYRFAALHQY